MKISIRSKILFAVSLLFGLFFINAGLNEFFHYMPVQKDLPEQMIKAFGAFMEIGWVMPLVGIAEVIGGLLIITPRTRALGVLIIFPVMIGIFLTNIVQNKSALPVAFVFGGILIWIMFENRNKYLLLLKK